MAKKISQARAEEMREEVQSMFYDAISATEKRVPQLIESMSFYRGLQWGTATPIGWFQDDFDINEAREVLNYVRPTVRTAVSDILRSMPNPEVVSAKSDQLSIARAEASQKLLRSFVRGGVLNFEQLLRAETSAQIHGAAWYKVIWDPNAGEYHDFPMTNPEDDEPVVDDFGDQKSERRANGEISVQFVDMISAPCDPHALSEGEVHHVFHRKMFSTRVLDDQFPTDAFGKSTEGRWMVFDRGMGVAAEEYIQNDGRSFVSNAEMGSSSSSPGNVLSELIEFWEKPSNTYPGGRLLVFSGSMIISIGPLPYEWPWVLRLGQNILPSGLFPDGVVRDIIPIQRTINLNASKKKEWLDKILSPPLLVPHGSGINADMFSDMAGEIVEYNQGMKPDWMRVPDIPGGMFNIEDQAVSVLQTISTYSDISRGEPPQGYDSGRALAYLYEFQKSVHEPDVHLFKIDMGRVLMKCLRLARDFYEDGRMVRILGRNNEWLMVPFDRGNYDFDAEIVVEPFSGKPNSRALRFAETIELFQLGAFDPENPAAKALRDILDVDYDDRDTHDYSNVHTERCRSEQIDVLMDPYAEIEVLGQDDHEIHLDMHTTFAVTPEFLELAEDTQDRFREHIADHEEWLMQQNEQYSEEQSMLAGQTQSPQGGAPPPKAPQLPSPTDGGHGPYEEMGEPELPAIEEPLPPSEIVQ